MAVKLFAECNLLYFIASADLFLVLANDDDIDWSREFLRS